MRVRGSFSALLIALSAFASLPVTRVVAADSTVVVAVKGALHAIMDNIPDHALCDAQGGAYAPGPTDDYYSGTSTYVGTFEGTARFCGHTTGGGVRPDGSLPTLETDAFTGIAHGCGKGSVTYVVQTSSYPLRVDPLTQQIPAEEDWQMVPGSSTGGLQVKSGKGHDKGVVNSDQSIDVSFTGTVTCVIPGTGAAGAQARVGNDAAGSAGAGFLPTTSAGPGAVSGSALAGSTGLGAALIGLLGYRRGHRRKGPREADGLGAAGA